MKRKKKYLHEDEVSREENHHFDDGCGVDDDCIEKVDRTVVPKTRVLRVVVVEEGSVSIHDGSQDGHDDEVIDADAPDFDYNGLVDVYYVVMPSGQFVHNLHVSNNVHCCVIRDYHVACDILLWGKHISHQVHYCAFHMVESEGDDSDNSSANEADLHYQRLVKMDMKDNGDDLDE